MYSSAAGGARRRTATQQRRSPSSFFMISPGRLDPDSPARRSPPPPRRAASCACASPSRARARRLSASRLVRRSSSVAIGSGVRVFSARDERLHAARSAASAYRRGCDGIPTTIAAIPSSSPVELGDPPRDALHRVGVARDGDRLERPRQRPRRVADRQPDAPRADVHREDPSRSLSKWYSFFSPNIIVKRILLASLVVCLGAVGRLRHRAGRRRSFSRSSSSSASTAWIRASSRSGWTKASCRT